MAGFAVTIEGVVAEAVRGDVDQDMQQPAQHLVHDAARQDRGGTENQQEIR